MVGSSMRRDEGSFAISNNNVFSALESLRKKKKSDKEKKSKGSSKAPAKEPEPHVFWAPTPLTAKSWADVDDEDDDDYYATTAAPQAVWSNQDAQGSKEVVDVAEESESEDDMLDLGDEDVEDEHEHEHEHEQEVIHPDSVANKVPETPLPVKETERQLSKKERKKKELEELDALLADFGVTQKESNGQSDALKEVAQSKKEEADDNGDKVGAPSESKNAKKKKKKDKSLKEVKETEDQPNSSDVIGEPNEEDMKERLKKMASMKKKKAGKDLDGAAKAAAQESAARTARLAAAKKKEKNHYNQQPVR